MGKIKLGQNFNTLYVEYDLDKNFNKPSLEVNTI